MATSTVVLITGVGRGIGRALAKAYLSKPNHIVIGSIRDVESPKASELKSLSTASDSRLILTGIESTSATDPHQVVKEIEAAGIDHLDIVIANAGAFNVNALAPIVLFQAVKPLLEKATSPKWVSVSSGAGSVALLKQYESAFVGAYGLSKAAMNWFTVAAHAGNKFLIAFAIHPGLVQSDMGNSAAKQMGLELAPNSLEESSTKILELIEKSTRESTSGKFINVIDGTELPW
ncbi:Short-chain dehydrogenase RED3 [Cladobotryum mycophilum]|uniref:Short-chain dehydrogenase RED3 n=1 Tax=Cladobotryum mycophilum TaxID=491253 RepID=A0ABR0SPE9_9HYPO